MQKRCARQLLVGVMGVLFFSSIAVAEPMLINQEARTDHYRLDLQIGPPEKMFSLAQLAAQHPTSGEVMVGGQMSPAMGGMAMDMGAARHLEVHVYSLDKGAVLTDANVAITVAGADPKKLEDLQIAKMYGIQQGVGDTHYGNNVSLPPGNYTVTVTVNGEKATFTVMTAGG